MVDLGGEFTFFKSIHVRIDISISIRTMTIMFGKMVHLEELTQIRLIKQVLVTLSCQDHMTA